MKKILVFSTTALRTGLAIKGVVDTLLSPAAAVRNFIKKIVVKSLVFIVKKSINIAMKDKTSVDSHVVIQQLNALTDSNADTSKINKNITFKVSLDTLIENVDEVEEYKVLKFINLTKAKNKISQYKNSLRKDIYEYISEDNFKNVNSVVNSVNEILKIPTNIVGCEFAHCTVVVGSHDTINHDFLLNLNVCLCVKSSS